MPHLTIIDLETVTIITQKLLGKRRAEHVEAGGGIGHPTRRLEQSSGRGPSRGAHETRQVRASLLSRRNLLIQFCPDIDLLNRFARRSSHMGGLPTPRC